MIMSQPSGRYLNNRVFLSRNCRSQISQEKLLFSRQIFVPEAKLRGQQHQIAKAIVPRNKHSIASTFLKSFTDEYYL